VVVWIEESPLTDSLGAVENEQLLSYWRRRRLVRRSVGGWWLAAEAVRGIGARPFPGFRAWRRRAAMFSVIHGC
jgi:hypothetical protein